MDVVNFIQDLPVAKTQNFQTNEVKKMSIQFSPNHDDEASIVKKYREYRKVTKDLVQTVLEKFVDNQSLRFAGRLMGILQQKTFMLESEEDMEFVMDFCLFEYQINGKNLWQRYQEALETAQSPRGQTLGAPEHLYGLWQGTNREAGTWRDIFYLTMWVLSIDLVA